jgi:hypothetical protein
MNDSSVSCLSRKPHATQQLASVLILAQVISGQLRFLEVLQESDSLLVFRGPNPEQMQIAVVAISPSQLPLGKVCRTCPEFGPRRALGNLHQKTANVPPPTSRADIQTQKDSNPTFLSPSH